MKEKLTVGALALQSLYAGVAMAEPADGGTDAQTPTTNITIVTSTDPIGFIIDAIRTFGGWVLLIAGAIAIVMLVIGGIRYVTSAGNSTQTEGAKKTIIYALIGLAVIILALVLAGLVGAMFGTTGGSGTE